MEATWKWTGEGIRYRATLDHILVQTEIRKQVKKCGVVWDYYELPSDHRITKLHLSIPQRKIVKKDGVRTTKQDKIPTEPPQEQEKLQKASRTRKHCRQFCKSLADSEESGLNVDQLRREIEKALEERWVYAGQNLTALEVTQNAQILNDGIRLVTMKKKYEHMWTPKREIHGKDWFTKNKPDIVKALKHKRTLYQRWQKMRQSQGNRAQEVYYLYRKMKKENRRVRQELRKIRSDFWVALSDNIQDFFLRQVIQGSILERSKGYTT